RSRPWPRRRLRRWFSGAGRRPAAARRPRPRCPGRLFPHGRARPGDRRLQPFAATRERLAGWRLPAHRAVHGRRHLFRRRGRAAARRRRRPRAGAVVAPCDDLIRCRGPPPPEPPMSQSQSGSLAWSAVIAVVIHAALWGFLFFELVIYLPDYV